MTQPKPISTIFGMSAAILGFIIFGAALSGRLDLDLTATDGILILILGQLIWIEGK